MALDALNNIVDNNAPVLGSRLMYLTSANHKLGHDLAEYFTDQDLDDDGTTLDYRVIALHDVNGNTPRGDVLVLQGTTLTFDPNGSYADLELGETVDLWATIVATDSHGASVQELIPITIFGLADPGNYEGNRAPYSQTELVMVMESDQSLSYDLARVFDDLDADDDGTTLDYRVTALTDADGNTPHGDVLVMQGTTLTFDPNGLYDDLEIGETVNLWATVIATDSHGASVEEQIEIEIRGNAEPENYQGNRAPYPQTELVMVMESDQSLSYDLARVFDDLDADDDGTTLDYRVTALTDADGNTPHGDVLVMQGTTLTFDPNGFYDDLEVGETVNLWATVIATDSHGASVEEQIKIEIRGNAEPENYQGNAPHMTLDALGLGARSDSFIYYDLDRIFDDVDPEDDGSTLEYSIISATNDDDGTIAMGAFTMSQNRLIFDSADMYNHLGHGEMVDITIVVQAQDSTGLYVQEDIHLRVFGDDSPINEIGQAISDIFML